MIDRSKTVTVLEAAQALGLTKSAVWKRVNTNRVPQTKVGNVTLIRFGDVVSEEEAVRLWGRAGSEQQQQPDSEESETQNDARND